MAHFAELDENNIVVRVVVVANAAMQPDGIDNEQMGVDLLESLYGQGRWKQTSYSGSIRKNYAGIGMTYDATRDAFIAPRPFPSWTLDESTCQYVPPVPRPLSGLHQWDEANQQWIAVVTQ